MTPQRSRVYIESRREMPFNLKSRRPPDISNNNACDGYYRWLGGEGGAVRGPFNSMRKRLYIRILPPRLKTPG